MRSISPALNGLAWGQCCRAGGLKQTHQFIQWEGLEGSSWGGGQCIQWIPELLPRLLFATWTEGAVDNATWGATRQIKRTNKQNHKKHDIAIKHKTCNVRELRILSIMLNNNKCNCKKKRNIRNNDEWWHWEIRSDIAKRSWLHEAASVTNALDAEQFKYYGSSFMLHFINKCFV